MRVLLKKETTLKSLLLLLMVTAMLFLATPLSASAAEILLQDENGVYLIGSAEDMFTMAAMMAESTEYRGASYRLTADIDMAEARDGANQRLWLRQGATLTSTSAFTGVFDGNGKTIYNLKIEPNLNSSMTATHDYGLFSYISGETAIVKDLTLENCRINIDNRRVSNNIGCIAGTLADGATIENCAVKNASIYAAQRFGGIVGQIEKGNATIKDCYFSGIMTGCSTTANGSGGIVGWVNVTGGSTVEILNCYVENTEIKPLAASAGGIVGNFTIAPGGVSGLISGCYFSGNINSSLASSTQASKGGILGLGAGNADAYIRIENCYSTGKVSNGGNYFGGIAGNPAYVAISNCYTTMAVEGNSRLGGIAGDTGTAGPVIIEDCLALNPSITAASSTTSFFGALTNPPREDVTLINTYAWEGMLLRRVMSSSVTQEDILKGITEGHHLYSPAHNGETFVTRTSLAIAAGWPASMTGNDDDSLWFYEKGKIPVLKAFIGLMSGEFPEYMGEPITHTVTFDFNDGLTEALASEVVEGWTVDRPADPAREGYLFLGWVEEGTEEAFSFDTAITANIILTARWQEIPVIVSVSLSASVEKLNGNKNNLTIIMTEFYSDGSENIITKTFSIDNNAAGVYEMGKYLVYVDTKGNDQIRGIHIAG